MIKYTRWPDTFARASLGPNGPAMRRPSRVACPFRQQPIRTGLELD
jgi:hypothetical protein